MKYLKGFLLFVFLLPSLASAQIISIVSYNVGIEVPVVLQVERKLPLKEKIAIEFKDIPIMIKISECESGFRQFKTDGTVLRGIVNSKDVGAFQINEKYHLENSKKLGYDIYGEDGNISMARYIYNASGTQPWNASKSCWSV